MSRQVVTQPLDSNNYFLIRVRTGRELELTAIAMISAINSANSVSDADQQTLMASFATAQESLTVGAFGVALLLLPTLTTNFPLYTNVFIYINQAIQDFISQYGPLQ